MKRVSLMIILLFTIVSMCLICGCIVKPNKMTYKYAVRMEYPTQQAAIKDECAEIKVYVGFQYNEEETSLEELKQTEIAKTNKLIFKYQSINEDGMVEYKDCLEIEENIFMEKFLIKNLELKQNFTLTIPLEAFDEDKSCLELRLYGINDELGIEHMLAINQLHYTKNSDVITISPKEGYLPYTFVEETI